MSLENPTARELFVADTSTLDDAVAEEMENRFFKQLRLPNGTAKTTYRHRLDDVIAVITGYVASAKEPLRLLDLGISSGVTTREWIDALDALGLPYIMDAVDLSIYGVLESVGPQLHVLSDTHGRALQFDIFGHALANHYGWGPRSFLRRAAPVTLARALFAVARFVQGQRKQLVARQIALLTRGLRDSRKLRLHEADLLHIGKFPGRYHLIRAANVLNLVYFEQSQLQSILQQLAGLLEPGGHLVVVRTREDAPVNDGSVFEKDASGRLAVVERFGAGSEVEPIVERLAA